LNLRDHLEAVKQKRGALTAEILVDEARAPEHPLHSRFEWDNSKAAELYRRDQARKLIALVEVVYTKADGSTDTVRAYHAVRRGANDYSFSTIDELAEDLISRELVLREMERDWTALYKRYETFEEFWELVNGTVNTVN
jgi:hypothetical protein